MMYIDIFALTSVSKSCTTNSILLSLTGNKLQTYTNTRAMHFNISTTELFYFIYKNIHPKKETAPATIVLYTILNNKTQRSVGIRLIRNLRLQIHMAKQRMAVSIRLYKLIIWLKYCRSEIVSCLVKATVISNMTFGLEVFTRAHINKDKITSINILLRRAAQVITGS